MFPGFLQAKSFPSENNMSSKPRKANSSVDVFPNHLFGATATGATDQHAAVPFLTTNKRFIVRRLNVAAIFPATVRSVQLQGA